MSDYQKYKAYHQEYQAKKQAALREQKLCLRCKGPAAPDKVRCDRCAELCAWRQRKLTKSYVEMGLCRIRGKPRAANSKSFCETHLQYNRDKVNEFRAKKKARTS